MSLDTGSIVVIIILAFIAGIYLGLFVNHLKLRVLGEVARAALYDLDAWLLTQAEGTYPPQVVAADEKLARVAHHLGRLP